MLQSEQPSITLNGTPNLAREYEAFMQGIELFSTLSVLVNQEPALDDDFDEGADEDDEEADLDSADSQNQANSKLMNEHKLDTCTVQVYPPLNPDHEYFRLPTNFMSHLGVHLKDSKDGFVIYG